MATEYLVLNENTLCYRHPGWRLVGVLAGSVVRGGHDPVNGCVPLSVSDRVRAATVVDFVEYRVSPVGHLPTP